MTRPVAVIAGDIVQSGRLSAAELDAAFAALGQAAAEISGWGGGEPTRFSRNRGDGWQVYLGDPTLALRAALFLRAALRAAGKGLATRMAVGTGAQDVPPPDDLNAASGAAFLAAGHALDAMKAPAELVIAGGAPALAAVFRLADHISQSWTQKQAEALMPMLTPGPTTQQDVAARRGITRQAVGQALAGSGFAALDDALRLIEGGAHSK